jgi:hypothetical protein
VTQGPTALIIHPFVEIFEEYSVESPWPMMLKQVASNFCWSSSALAWCIGQPPQNTKNGAKTIDSLAHPAVETFKASGW